MNRVVLPRAITSEVDAALGDREARRADCDQVTYPFVPIDQSLTAGSVV
jgi:hypothetical protein